MVLSSAKFVLNIYHGYLHLNYMYTLVSCCLAVCLELRGCHICYRRCCLVLGLPPRHHGGHCGVVLSTDTQQTVEEREEDQRCRRQKKEGEHEHNRRVEHKHRQTCGDNGNHESWSESETIRG
jgi:hypothetical protein